MPRLGLLRWMESMRELHKAQSASLSLDTRSRERFHFVAFSACHQRHCLFSS